MKSVHLSIRRIGNSQGFVIPKVLLAQLGLDETSDAELTVEGDALVVRKASPSVRAGWADAARSVALHGDTELVMGEFANEGDSELTW